MISTTTTIIIEANPNYEKGHPDLIWDDRFFIYKIIVMISEVVLHGAIS